ncbi:MAG: histidine kinase dimerization/phospho-acceptor domain-containing protein, partial [Adhaeribacter sp.]
MGVLSGWLQLLRDRFKPASLLTAGTSPQEKEDFHRVHLPDKKILADTFSRETRPAGPYPGSLLDKNMRMPVEKPPLCSQEAEELARTGFWELQLKTGFFHCSPNALKLVNSQAGTQDLSFAVLIANFHEADKTQLSQSWDELLTSQKEIDYDARITDLFGEKWIKIKAKAIWEKSTVIKITGFLQDITETKVLEEQLRQACQAAELDARARTTFVSEVSHELRTPLNAISGFTYLLLQEDVSQEEQQEYLRSIQFSTQNLLSLVNETLDFAKIEAGKVEFEHIQFQFHELLQDLHRSFYLRATEKKLALSLDIAAGTPELAVGDPSKLCQILNNLVSNAIKFTREGEVKIAVEVVYES